MSTDLPYLTPHFRTRDPLLTRHWICHYAQPTDSQKNWDAHQGIWQKSHINSFVARKTIPLLVMVALGLGVSVLAEAMGMHIKYYDIKPSYL